MSSLEGHVRITRAALEFLQAARTSASGFDAAALERRVIAPDVLDLLTLGHWRDAAQRHHFMRRFDGQSAREAHAESVAWIRARATRAAAEIARALRAAPAKVQIAPPPALGDALHALQDSFAPGHAEREPAAAEQPGAIRHVYLYAGAEKQGHGEADLAWRGPGPGGLSPLGRQAARASCELLRLVVDAASGAGASVSLEGFEHFRETWLAASVVLSADRGRPIAFLRRF